MSVPTTVAPKVEAPKAPPTPRQRRRWGNSLLAQGEPSVWLTGGALAVAIFMIVGLLALVVVQGASTFWPVAAVEIKTIDGKTLLGEVTRTESYKPEQSVFDALPAAEKEKAQAEVEKTNGVVRRRLLRTGNFDLTGVHHNWVSDFQIAAEELPANALVVERFAWGNFYGTPTAFFIDGKKDADNPEDAWKHIQDHHPGVLARLQKRISLERHEKGELARNENDARLAVKEAELRQASTAWKLSGAGFRHFLGAALMMVGVVAWSLLVVVAARSINLPALLASADDRVLARGLPLILALLPPLIFGYAIWPAPWKWEGNVSLPEAQRRLAEVQEHARVEGDRIQGEITELNHENDRYQVVLVTADGQEKKLPLAQIARAYRANQVEFGDKLSIYFSRWGEFLSERPREANTEGGVFPAIWGTVAMTLLMSLAVVPFGVLAALYLREYAKSGPIISAVRIAINNLAGVPSIVFGVFGLGFFCYLIGGFIDGGPEKFQIEPLPPAAWWIALTLTVLAGLAAFTLFIGSTQSREKSRWSGWCRRGAGVLWPLCLALMIYLIVKSPFFDGFYRAKLPSPTFGTGGILWAALTLSLLTLPVVIVATEEALAAVPNSMREGSYACGASKWQTIRHIVLPRAMPGIMTGMILAMARGAGEVAPIMLVGAVKLVEHLPVDGVFPFVHMERSFMHLGYHIFDVGFQSPNSEAARPMVYTTTLLLIVIVALLNLTAVGLRRRLRARFMASQF